MILIAAGLVALGIFLLVLTAVVIEVSTRKDKP